MLKVGLIGLGTMGKVHAAAYSQIEDVQLTAVADLREELRDMARHKYSGVQVFSTGEELLAKAEVDLVDICLPTYLHEQFVLKAAEAGKHVFCEKPLARTSEQAQRMLAAVKQHGKKFGVGHVVRFFPEYVQARQQVQEGRIGKPAVVRTFRGGMLFPQAWQDWYADYDKSGGLVLDMIIHDFDYLRWCFGEVDRVYAKSTTGRTEERLEYALVVLRFKNGVIAHVEGSWSNVPGPFYTTLEISGDEGMISYDSRKSAPIQLAVTAQGDQPGVAVPESPLAESPYLTEIKHFIDCIKENKDPMISGQEAEASLKVSLAAMESIKTGRVVYL